MSRSCEYTGFTASVKSLFQTKPLEFLGNPAPLEHDDFERAAADLGISVAAVKAVVEVESRGSGFLRDGRPKILFEAHIFSRETGGRFDRDHPEISASSWDRSLYAGGAGEYERLRRAQVLDETAALKSCSWGLFQIMGFNHRHCGFSTVREFVEAMKSGEAAHLSAFCEFIRSQGMLPYLQKRDWAGFAHRYNGPGYRENRYDEKLKSAYERNSR